MSTISGGEFALEGETRKETLKRGQYPNEYYIDIKDKEGNVVHESFIRANDEKHAIELAKRKNPGRVIEIVDRGPSLDLKKLKVQSEMFPEETKEWKFEKVRMDRVKAQAERIRLRELQGKKNDMSTEQTFDFIKEHTEVARKEVDDLQQTLPGLSTLATMDENTSPELRERAEASIKAKLAHMRANMRPELSYEQTRHLAELEVAGGPGAEVFDPYSKKDIERESHVLRLKAMEAAGAEVSGIPKLFRPSSDLAGETPQEARAKRSAEEGKAAMIKSRTEAISKLGKLGEIIHDPKSTTLQLQGAESVLRELESSVFGGDRSEQHPLGQASTKLSHLRIELGNALIERGIRIEDRDKSTMQLFVPSVKKGAKSASETPSRMGPLARDHKGNVIIDPKTKRPVEDVIPTEMMTFNQFAESRGYLGETKEQTDINLGKLQDEHRSSVEEAFKNGDEVLGANAHQYGIKAPDNYMLEMGGVLRKSKRVMEKLFNTVMDFISPNQMDDLSKLPDAGIEFEKTDKKKGRKTSPEEVAKKIKVQWESMSESEQRMFVLMSNNFTHLMGMYASKQYGTSVDKFTGMLNADNAKSKHHVIDMLMAWPRIMRGKDGILDRASSMGTLTPEALVAKLDAITRDAYELVQLQDKADSGMKLSLELRKKLKALQESMKELAYTDKSDNEIIDAAMKDLESKAVETNKLMNAAEDMVVMNEDSNKGVSEYIRRRFLRDPEVRATMEATVNRWIREYNHTTGTKQFQDNIFGVNKDGVAYLDSKERWGDGATPIVRVVIRGGERNRILDPETGEPISSKDFTSSLTEAQMREFMVGERVENAMDSWRGTVQFYGGDINRVPRGERALLDKRIAEAQAIPDAEVKKALKDDAKSKAVAWLKEWNSQFARKTESWDAMVESERVSDEAGGLREEMENVITPDASTEVSSPKSKAETMTRAQELAMKAGDPERVQLFKRATDDTVAFLWRAIENKPKIRDFVFEATEKEMLENMRLNPHQALRELGDRGLSEFQEIIKPLLKGFTTDRYGHMTPREAYNIVFEGMKLAREKLDQNLSDLAVQTATEQNMEALTKNALWKGDKTSEALREIVASMENRVNQNKAEKDSGDLFEKLQKNLQEQKDNGCDLRIAPQQGQTTLKLRERTQADILNDSSPFGNSGRENIVGPAIRQPVMGQQELNLAGNMPPKGVE